MSLAPHEGIAMQSVVMQSELQDLPLFPLVTFLSFFLSFFAFITLYFYLYLLQC